MVALVVAAASVLVLVYTYVGYPLAIAALARLRPRPVTIDRAFRPPVTVCIPMHNAAGYVGRKLDSLLAQDYPADRLEILICSDGSTDDSDAIVRDYADRDSRVRLIRSERRRGKPHALNLMRAAARGEVLLMADVRQPFNRDAVRELVSRLADPRVGCVSGKLVLEGQHGAGAYWAYESWIRRSESRAGSVIGVSGSIYVVRKDDLAPVPEDTILDDVWIPMRLHLDGRRILLCEEARAYDATFDDDREFDRKVRTLAGNYQLFARLPALLSPVRNRSWFATVSHKLLRLVCPWGLVSLFASSLAGAAAAAAGPGVRALFVALLVGQVLFYAAAVLGHRAGAPARIARTFVVLNAAAVVGLWRFVRGSQRITW